MEQGYELTKINSEIYSCLNRACINSEPILALLVDNEFVSKEGLLWDYKSSFSDDAVAIAKTVMQIVSFHNTCGGYLVYGVSETIKDKEFVPVNIDLSSFDPAKLRNKITEYTDSSIDVTFGEVEYFISGEKYIAGLLHIPKRNGDVNPISFLKNGPIKSSNKPLFNKNTTYFRNQDQCLQALKHSDWQTLYSSRDFSPNYGAGKIKNTTKKNMISHNLPSKSLICSNFIGREMSLTSLWEWLSDEFEQTKILSGDGGKGKTSIAYEFCRTFVLSPPAGYERVVWLSVKERQFSGLGNEYFDLSESDFTDSKSFLKCLGENCALETEDYDELSSTKIKRELIGALKYFPSLYVVDDIDSLEEDEQRKVVDNCRQLGSVNVRFLITTRKKLAYSSDLCIDVPGLPIEDFEKYIAGLVEKLTLTDIRSKDMKKLHQVSDGSPLLSASILRLYKQGIPLAQAINDWSGCAGEDARSAALKREIESLTIDSKRILLAIYYFKSCSFTELKQAVGVEKIKLFDCLEELQSLFLVSEPRIIDNEERFSISNTTALIVGEIKDEMAFDYKKLFETVKGMRKGTASKKSGNRKKVGLAINQSLALLRDGREVDAIKTIDHELEHLPRNPDLLLMKARCLMSLKSTNYDTVRTILRDSYQSGQRKELAFDLWYQAELELDSPNGIIEVSEYALKEDCSDVALWNERLARGFVLRSSMRSEATGIRDLMDASLALTNSLRVASSKELRVQELSSLHNLIWERLEDTRDYSWLSSFDLVYDLIKRGDTRTVMYENANRCLVEAKAEGKMSEKKKEAYNICVRKLTRLIDERANKDKIDRPFLDIKSSLLEL
jgi:hypothetical protein